MKISERKDYWIKMLVACAVSIAVALGLLAPYHISYVPSESMYPTLEIGEVLFSSRNTTNIEFEDIVVFYPNAIPEKDNSIISDLKNKVSGIDLWVKRVIGMPGDTITITGGNVYRNGEMVASDYTLESTSYGEINEYVVPEDYYYLMGDNRNNSKDSRIIGAIHIDNIYGVVTHTIAPIFTVN